MTDLKKTFGRRLQTIRKSKGLTQEELGRRTGIDYKHLGAIERGMKAPSFDLVEKLAKTLKVEHYFFFLPVENGSIDLQADLDAALTVVRQARRHRIQDFLQEVLRAIKRLDAT